MPSCPHKAQLAMVFITMMNSRLENKLPPKNAKIILSGDKFVNDLLRAKKPMKGYCLRENRRIYNKVNTDHKNPHQQRAVGSMIACLIHRYLCRLHSSEDRRHPVLWLQFRLGLVRWHRPYRSRSPRLCPNAV